MGAPDLLVWHDVECGSYDADLPLWRELAREAGGSVLDVGAGAGRVSLDLAREGHRMTALDREPALLAALRDRAAAEGLSVETVEGDARELRLSRRFSLVVVPMQTIQLLGGREGRRAFLRRAHEHLEPGGLLAGAVAAALEGFVHDDRAALPLPDVREQDGWVFSSQPVGLRAEGDVTVIERLRQVVSPDGTLAESRDEVRLDRLDAAQLAAEAADEGFEPLPARHIAPTRDHVGSDVALMRV